MLLFCGCRGCDLARPPLRWCLHLRNFACSPCQSVWGTSCQNCRHWWWKWGTPSVHAYPYIQPRCFIAYHPLVPVRALSCSSSLSFLFPLLSLLFTPIPCTSLEQLLLWLPKKSVLWYRKLLYSCMTLEKTCWPPLFCQFSLTFLISSENALFSLSCPSWRFSSPSILDMSAWASWEYWLNVFFFFFGKC